MGPFSTYYFSFHTTNLIKRVGDNGKTQEKSFLMCVPRRKKILLEYLSY